MEEKILVVDDEKGIVDAISYAFRREGYIVETAYDGQEALNKLSIFCPNVIILDVMMPKMSGLEVCKRLDHGNDMGIILLTAKNDIVDKVLGLELGADDYITKPFDIRELVARTKSILRRLQKNSEKQQVQKIEIRDLIITAQQRKVILYGEEIEMTPKEFDLLLLLLSSPERVYARDDLLNLVWGVEYAGGTRTVDIHVQRLRSKLGEPYQDLIQTVYGIGYKAIGDIYENKY
ncbi:DNA-binding response OmpR family regulator [Anaerosolibacter carboniphilus]|uniref:Stage 0 sporulation protein A homolog n=1 Tax=Anaerosolibacter carboniphilus TaxID=1417629 RepID=A0A841KM00_9FIRM|nr:response regulator transcription factor [Anaerosolibacter carboniphilus]MBB6214271.1 DNA-binding response OmpR family regulator [Anaerosolibacter carboniphilus]